MDLKKISDINPKEVSKKITSSLYQKRKWIAFSFILIMAGYCSYLWYFNIYNHVWTDQQKEQYALSNSKNFIYDSRKFDKIINEISARSSQWGKEVTVKNIFSFN